MLAAFQERIRDAAARGAPLRLRGGGSKDFYGGALEGEVLDTRGHAGVVSYEPTELVVTARCGTPLADLEATLAGSGQMLAFEPPHFGAGATLGGCVAAGLSGPRRATAGAVRDFVLGARLLTGSLGTLGLILEVSLKVLPRPPQELTLALELPEDKALDAFNRWAGSPLPLSASAWRDGDLGIRLSGAPSAVRSAAKKIGGQIMDAVQAERFWSGIREHTDAYFAGELPLWRLSLPAHAAPLGLPGAQLIEWGGALRWLRTPADAQAVRAAAARAGGHATLFRGGNRRNGVFAPLAPGLLKLHRGLKAAFDPAGVFNRGRMYPDF